jgi:hypothetical protein
MRDEVRDALLIDPAATIEQRTIDITTTGRRSGAPRRIEIVFYRFETSTYLSGRPAPRPRAWLLNLAAEPQFVFHLTHGVSPTCRRRPRSSPIPPSVAGSSATSWRSSTRAMAPTVRGRGPCSRSG